MGRLKALKPRVASLGARTAAAPTFSDDRPRGRPWGRTRRRILTRDMGVCQCDECRRTGAVKPATEVDHHIPREDGGSEADDNLRAINAECHKRKTAQEAAKRAGLPRP